MKFRPLRNLVLVKEHVKKEKTSGGIIIPDMVNDSVTSKEVTILAAGPGTYSEKGEFIPMQVKVGDVVVVSTIAGQEQIVNGEKLLLIVETDILGII